MSKPGRNQDCPCGSGAKYKFCCIGNERIPRLVTIDPTARRPHAPKTVDLTDDLMNVVSGMNRPLHYFCKEQGLFLASSVVTVGQTLGFTELLKAGLLTKEALLDAYRTGATRAVALGWIEDACASFPSFSPRRQILLDAANAHFDGSYTLSVPVFFTLIEGILRDIGSLEPRSDLKPTIKRDWDSRTLFGLSEGAGHFNAFLHRLFEGRQQSGGLNRNPVLHGGDITYPTVENSLILLLVILEIRTFLWFEHNTRPLL